MFASQLSHPCQVCVPLLDGHIQIHASQFLAERPNMEIALDLTPGMQGTAQTTLRPSGKGRFADHVVDVITEGEFISADTPITVIQKDGMRVVVKAR